MSSLILPDTYWGPGGKEREHREKKKDHRRPSERGCSGNGGGDSDVDR